MRTAFVIFLTLSVIGCSRAKPVSVGLVNESRWAIAHLYLSPQNENTWGVDQLGEDEILKSGQSLLLEDVPAGLYDGKIIDEDDDTCIVTGIKIEQDRNFVLTDEKLLKCEDDTEDAGLE